MNLQGWTYLLTYGYDLDIYAMGAERVVVERETKRVLFRYYFSACTGGENSLPGDEPPIATLKWL
ncbi:hypothetical protein ES703_72617 [subsurface metagenome]